MTANPDFNQHLAKLEEEHPLTPAALEILQEHKKLDGSIQNVTQSFCEYKDNQDELCKTMVRMKRVRDAFEEQKEGCLEVMQREGKSRKMMVVVACIDASLEFIRYMQDIYQNMSLKVISNIPGRQQVYLLGGMSYHCSTDEQPDDQ